MAKSIKTFRLSRMSLGTCCGFHHTVLAEITNTGAEVLHIAHLVPAYQAQIRKVQSVVVRPTTFLATGSFRKADLRRDRGVGYIKMAVRAAATSIVDDKRSAGQMLMQQLKRFRGTKDMKRTEATSVVHAMLAVLDHPNNAQAIDELDLRRDVEALRLANQQVCDAMEAKREEIAERLPTAHIDTAREIKVLNKQYTHIAKVVNAIALAFAQPQIDDFVDGINAIAYGVKMGIAHSGSNQLPRKKKTRKTGKERKDS